MTDVEDSLAKAGLEGRVIGYEYVAPCPMHEARTGRSDANPSWSVNLKTGVHHCFSCGYKGNLVTLARDLEVEFDDVRTLSWVDDKGQSQRVTLPDLTRVITAAADYIDESLLGRFTRPPQWALDARRVTSESCRKYSVMWDQYTDSWILPIRDARTSGLLGWQVKGQSSRVFRNYPAGVRKSRTLFGIDAFACDRMVVVESPLDAVRLHSEGVDGAVAVMGAAVSQEQLYLMAAASEVIFALDNPRLDSAGRKSVERLLTDTKGVLMSVRFFDYRGIEAKDPGDMEPEEIHTGIDAAKSRAYGAAILA